MDREKIPRTICAVDTFVIDPEDDEQECTRPCCRKADASTHWGQWLRPA
ncbi:hypothetical protein [Kitasatospora sp. GP82]|nr:hypothetical protein [Kitasatospora sp. GP82]MDH6128288.1 hypothetical protein [Kitasatospora sp. GP82]